MNCRCIQRALLRWFDANKRPLPWRTEPRDPYRVWVSEVMLQQTQARTVIPYFERWMARFPTVQALAEASLDEVLKMWEGLGYYSRARNLHRAARHAVTHYGGALPRAAEALRALPGVGRYTAGAIASIAFNQRTPVVDGNVRRVLCRLFARADDADIWALAESLLPEDRPGAFNEALMELGALVCTPRAPRCAICPLRRLCAARAAGTPEAFPAPRRSSSTPLVRVQTAVIVAGDAVLMGQRPAEGLLGGLWEFISSELRDPPQESLAMMVERRVGLDVSAAPATLLGETRHAFTHFRLVRTVWLLHLDAQPAPTRKHGYARVQWVRLDELPQLALTRSDRRVWHMAKDVMRAAP
ncbi:MAG: A/G-specific adenine glycosylase [Thermoflexales bacterium]|nr:A/G-specific adenine glycosylase [Thermoflexales bacterium]